VLLSVANQAGVPKICLTRAKYGVGAARIDLHAGLGCCCWRRGGPAVLWHGQAYSVRCRGGGRFLRRDIIGVYHGEMQCER
jgi:hypothetical protein